MLQSNACNTVESIPLGWLRFIGWQSVNSPVAKGVFDNKCDMLIWGVWHTTGSQNSKSVFIPLALQFYVYL